MTRPTLNLTILGLRPSMLFRFYGWRLRRHTAQELLAGGGIAVGVALVFGVLVANGSLMGSAGDLLHGLVGSARLQLVARSSEGFDERLANTVRRLPGVGVAAATLREDAIVVGPRGRESIQLIGVDPNIVLLGVLGSQETGPRSCSSHVRAGIAGRSGEHHRRRPGRRVESARGGRAHSDLRPPRTLRRPGRGSNRRHGGDRAAATRADAHGQARPCHAVLVGHCPASGPACRPRASAACRRTSERRAGR